MDIQYNRAATCQSEVFTRTKANLDHAIERLNRTFKDVDSLVIAELGCSHGSNSMHLLDFILDGVRVPQEGGPSYGGHSNKEVVVYHEDQPCNDWVQLSHSYASGTHLIPTEA